MTGPFDSWLDAEHASLWETRGRDTGMTMTAANTADLAAELSGVELGAYDQKIIAWLAGYEPATIAVICGLIRRARAAGEQRQADILDSEVIGQVFADAICFRDPQGICPDCDEHPAGLCEDHAADLDRTDAYIALAGQLGIEAVDR
jgi:hypothetical protein